MRKTAMLLGAWLGIFAFLAYGAFASPHAVIAPERPAPKADDPYAYLLKKFRIPALLCISDEQCGAELVPSENFSALECNIRASQTVAAFVIGHGYERFSSIGPCEP